MYITYSYTNKLKYLSICCKLNGKYEFCKASNHSIQIYENVLSHFIQITHFPIRDYHTLLINFVYIFSFVTRIHLSLKNL